MCLYFFLKLLLNNFNLGPIIIINNDLIIIDISFIIDKNTVLLSLYSHFKNVRFFDVSCRITFGYWQTTVDNKIFFNNRTNNFLNKQIHIIRFSWYIFLCINKSIYSEFRMENCDIFIKNFIRYTAESLASCREVLYLGYQSPSTKAKWVKWENSTFMAKPRGTV